MSNTPAEPLFRAARFLSGITIPLLTLPVLAGLAGTLLPAFGYLPAIGETTLSLDPFRRLFAEPGMQSAIFLSVFTGLSATFLSVILAALILAAGYGSRFWTYLSHLLSPILAIPHAAAAFGFAFMLAPSGFAARLLSPWATGWTNPPDILFLNDPLGLSLIAGLVVKEVPFLLLMLLAALNQSDASQSIRMANALGYGHMAGFMLALWPRLYRQIRFAVFAVLAFSASVVDVSLILGPTTPGTLVTMVLRWMNDSDLGLRLLASAGAILQLALVLGLFVFWLALEKVAGAMRTRLSDRGTRFARDRLLTALGRTAGMVIALVVLGGIALLGLWSFAGLWGFPDALPQTLSAHVWMKIMPSIADPLATTLATAGLSALLAVFLSISILAGDHRSRAINTLLATALALPMVVPQIAFLFGLQIVALKLGVGYGLPALVLAHFLFVMPYVHLSLSQTWTALDPRYEQVAMALGHSRSSALLRIRLPLLLRPILTAFAVGFAVSVGLYLPTVLIGAGRLPTITTEAVALASGSNRRIIGAYAFLQAALPFLGFVLAFVIPAWLFRNRAMMRTG